MAQKGWIFVPCALRECLGARNAVYASTKRTADCIPSRSTVKAGYRIAAIINFSKLLIIWALVLSSHGVLASNAAADGLLCSQLLTVQETNSAEFREAYEDGRKYFSIYLNVLEDIGLITQDELSKYNSSKIQAIETREFIKSKLSFEEMALLRQIVKNQSSDSLYSMSLRLPERIKNIFQSYARGPARMAQLLWLRKEVYIRHPGIEWVFKDRIAQIGSGQADAGKTTIYGEDGLLHAVELRAYDSLSGMGTIQIESGKYENLPIGDIYGRMPATEVKRWGFAEPDGWQYGKTSGYIYEVKWQKVGEKQTSLGPVTLISSPDLPRNEPGRVYSYSMSDPRTFTVELAFLRELGFAYDAKSGVQTIPSVKVINHNLDRTGLSPYRLEQHFDRAEIPTLVFARALLRNVIPVGIEGMLVHDYSSHLAERLALPPAIFSVIQDQLKFWLSVYDDPTLQKNAKLRDLCELMLRDLIAHYDNLGLGSWLFGISFLDEDAPTPQYGRRVLDERAENLVHYWGVSVHEVAAEILDQLVGDGGRFESKELIYRYSEKGEYAMSTKPFVFAMSPSEIARFRHFAAQASNRKLDLPMVHALLGSQDFLRRFARAGHPLLQK